jgi:hypothetical protein
VLQRSYDVAQAEGVHYKCFNLEFYAERGLITLIDTEKAGDSRVPAHEAIQRIPPKDFIQRAIGTRLALKDSRPSEQRMASRLLDQATAACKLAIAQGDPTDPETVSTVMRHVRKKSIIMPGEANSILGPVGGQRFKLQISSPRDMMLKGVQVVPDYQMNMADAMTPARAAALRKHR